MTWTSKQPNSLASCRKASFTRRLIRFLATARDDGEAEWRARIARHRRERPSDWRTLEEPLDLAGALGALHPGEVALVDCITVWLSNLAWEAYRGVVLQPGREAKLTLLSGATQRRFW